jgi:hypothetical protein
MLHLNILIMVPIFMSFGYKFTISNLLGIKKKVCVCVCVCERERERERTVQIYHRLLHLLVLTVQSLQIICEARLPSPAHNAEIFSSMSPIHLRGLVLIPYGLLTVTGGLESPVSPHAGTHTHARTHMHNANI